MIVIFLIALIGGLLCLWISYVAEDEHPKVYAFFLQGMIWFGVFFVISLVIGIFTVSGQIIGKSNPAPYFSHIFDNAVSSAILAGLICGTLSAYKCKKIPRSKFNL